MTWPVASKMPCNLSALPPRARFAAAKTAINLGSVFDRNAVGGSGRRQLGELLGGGAASWMNCSTTVPDAFAQLDSPYRW